MIVIKVAVALSMFFWLCAAATASDAQRQINLASLYHYSGVHAHLADVSTTVENEMIPALQDCPDASSKPNLDTTLPDLLSAQSIKAEYIEELSAQLTDLQIEFINAWVNSPAGIKVHQIEAESAAIKEPDFARLLEQYVASDKYTKSRATLIKKMLDNTGAVYFISAVNTESSALVLMASLCQLNEASLESVKLSVQSARGEEGLVRTFLRPELLLPAGVVYRNLTDEELKEFIAFTESDSGKAFYRALVQSVRLVLSGRVDRLEQTLETMLSSDGLQTD